MFTSQHRIESTCLCSFLEDQRHSHTRNIQWFIALDLKYDSKINNFTSRNTPISQVPNQFYLLLSLFPWIPFFAITRSGQGTLGTDKQLVLVFALVNKLEGESPAAWI